MRFLHPYLLLLELIVPALALAYVFAFRRRAAALRQFADQQLAAKLSSASRPLQVAKASLTTAAMFFIILALARPQFGTKLVEVKEQASDIVICVDVSTSMLAEDIKPNRLDRAKAVLGALVQQLGGNRVGIIAFAGTAFWQCPLTLDIASASMFLQIMDANLLPMPGTVIGDALRLADRGLAKTAPKSKAIVLLTDGEDHKSEPLAAAAEAAKNGVRVYTVGFGNPNGEPIPVKDEQGNFTGYKKNKKGETVMSKMDESLLLKVASETGGEYIRAQDGVVDVNRLADALQGLEKRKTASRMNREMEDRFQYPLGVGLVLLLVAFFLPEAKRKEAANQGVGK